MPGWYEAGGRHVSYTTTPSVPLTSAPSPPGAQHLHHGVLGDPSGLAYYAM